MIVLGCTHYPLVSHIVQQIAGDGVSVIENGTAVARELARQLDSRRQLRAAGAGTEAFWTSGPPDRIEAPLEAFWAKGTRASRLPEETGRHAVNARRE